MFMSGFIIIILFLQHQNLLITWQKNSSLSATGDSETCGLRLYHVAGNNFSEDNISNVQRMIDQQNQEISQEKLCQ